ncbi:UNVERIFIED_CONTAM: hypothetical protein FKN15_027415 [Acipenser sinensis]
MNTRCPPKRVPSADRFFSDCRLTMQPLQCYSFGGQCSSGQLKGKPAGARPDDRGRWCMKDAIGLWIAPKAYSHTTLESDLIIKIEKTKESACLVSKGKSGAVKSAVGVLFALYI